MDSIQISYEDGLRAKAKCWLEQWQRTDASSKALAIVQREYNTEKANLDSMEIGGVGQNRPRRNFVIGDRLVIVEWVRISPGRERIDICVEEIT